ncbi:MAG: glycosyltransferase family 4 protein [Candidatus Korobacteraceae bacterium]
MKILILNQAFYPDVVATGQYATDLALALTEAGHQVSVVSSARSYDDPSRRFTFRQLWKGITIHRVAPTGFGKTARWRRAADFASFMVKCVLRVLSLPRFDVVIALTSPPLISVAAAILAPLKGARVLHWTMDLNPDEAIASGWLRSGSLSAKILGALQRFSLQHADRIVALDSFMKERISSRGIDPHKIVVIPPWSLDDKVWFDAEGREEFRRQHGLRGKFVITYAGNHSPCHPLDTLLEAARRLSGDSRFKFCFVGGGSEYRKVQEFSATHGLSNFLCLPYQPLDKLSAMLSAADLHAVVMGDAFTGIVHPCKVYNVLAVGAPLLYIGPEASPITALLPRSKAAAFAARHGDVEGVIKAIQEAERVVRPAMRPAMIHGLSRQELLPRMVAVVETIAERKKRFSDLDVASAVPGVSQLTAD